MFLSDLKVIITGAGSGFGKAMSLFFSENNADVYALDLNYESLLDLKSENDKIQIPGVKKEDRPCALDLWNKDRIKKEFAEKQGFVVDIIWEKDYNENKEETIDKILKRILKLYESNDR